VHTGDSAPSTGIASFSTWKFLKQTRNTDGRHGIVELDRMGEFYQHDVAGEEASCTIEFVVDKEFTDWNANSELVGLRATMKTDYHDPSIPL